MNMPIPPDRKVRGGCGFCALVWSLMLAIILICATAWVVL
jgi:hypothetical protein